jgi:hypothetical protein
MALTAKSKLEQSLQPIYVSYQKGRNEPNSRIGEEGGILAYSGRDVFSV